MLPSGKPWGLTDSPSAGYASLARAVRRARSAVLFREHFGRANLSSLVSGVDLFQGLFAGQVPSPLMPARPVLFGFSRKFLPPRRKKSLGICAIVITMRRCFAEV